MSPDRLPRQVFHSELAHGRRPVGRPKKRYKDHLKSILKSCNIEPSNFEAMAVDRPGWRVAVRSGVATYEASLREKNEQARAARHQQPDPTSVVNSGINCDQCGQSVRNRAGLASHLRAHRRRLRGGSTSSNIDGPP